MTEREQEVVAVAALAAKAAEEEQPLLEMLCRSAVRYWEGRLRQDAAPEAYGDAFCCAAAYTAAADLVESRAEGSVAAFTAGDLSVKTTGRSHGAEGLRQTAERLMAPYARMEDMAFRGVRG